MLSECRSSSFAYPHPLHVVNSISVDAGLKAQCKNCPQPRNKNKQ